MSVQAYGVLIGVLLHAKLDVISTQISELRKKLDDDCICTSGSTDD